jgi:SNF2 family DNA or RNA helicase
MNLQINNDIITVSFPWSASLVNEVKDCGLKFNPKKKVWESPINFHVIDSLSRRFPDLDLPNTGNVVSPTWEPSPYLMEHQRQAAEIAKQYSRFGFFDDTGVGKTISAIEIIKQKGLKTLVVCPLSLIRNAWMKDIETFAPELSAVNLWEVFKKRKLNTLYLDHQIGIINFESFKQNKDKLSGYQMVIIDESSKVKDPRSQITKDLIAFTDKIPFVYLLSGTPAPNNEMEYWSQFRIIDMGILGKSYYQFRNHFCQSFGYGGYQWRLREDKREDFLLALSRRSRVVRKDDVLDLPERTFNIRSVYLDNKEMAAYKEMERNLLVEFGEQSSVAANVAVKIMKLREATSGFLMDGDGIPIKTGSSKVSALKELLEEIGDHQVIIWTHFHYEADQICKMLDHDFVRVDGTVSGQTVKDEMVKAFMEKKVKYLVSHPASLGHGVTLTNCQYAIYFSLSHSHEQHYQSRDRIYRNGQKNACTYYYMIAEHTVDKMILNCLDKKEDAALAVLKFLKKGGE